MAANAQPRFEGRPTFWGGPPKPADPEYLLSWEWVVARLESAPIYWVTTAGSSQAPQSRPIWGVWIDNMLNFGTGSPRQQRDIAVNDSVSVHLPSGADVVLLEGRFPVKRQDRQLRTRAREVYNRKYRWNFKVGDEDPGDLVQLFEPRTVIAWTDDGGAIPGNGAPMRAGKWTFAGHGDS